MKQWSLVALVLSAALALGGCVSTAQEDLAEAERVRKQIMDGIDTIMNEDVEAYVDTFDETGVLLAQNQDPYVGKEALTQFFERIWSPVDVTNRKHKVEEVRVSGDLAFAWGYFSNDVTPRAGGETRSAGGKFLVVFARDEDGNWKRHVLMPMREAPAK